MVKVEVAVVLLVVVEVEMWWSFWLRSGGIGNGEGVGVITLPRF